MTAFIFDLDGTLLDTLADIAAACEVALARYGAPAHSLDEYRRFVGNGFDKLVARALAPLNPPGIAEITAVARDYYGRHMMERTVQYPGMEQALKTLAQAGAKLAVLSNKPDALSKKLVTHYFPDIPFARVYGGREGVPLKPDPAGLLELKKELDCSHVFYVGDSDVDMHTAQAARCVPVGAAWGFRGREELMASGALLTLLEPSQLPMLLGCKFEKG